MLIEVVFLSTDTSLNIFEITPILSEKYTSKSEITSVVSVGLETKHC